MKKIGLMVSVLFLCLSATAQTKMTVTEEYIVRYRDIAISNEQQYGVPSSITLAQGIIESGSGRSTLAKESNNHFGIKCHSSWTGKTVYKDDDHKNECFRVYDNPEESFTDHSLFLKNNKRYSSLFDLDKSDYKAWASGLKQAGYATNPNYAGLLTDIIELYELDKVDNENFYLIADNTSLNTTQQEVDKSQSSDQTKDKPVKEEKKPKQKKTLMQRLFGGTQWYKRRHETEQERKRREMDEKIQKMIDEQDVKRNDFEVTFE